MRRSFRSRAQRLLYHLVDAIIANLPWRSRSRGITQTLKAHHSEAFAPFADSLFANTDAPCDFIIRETAITVQQNASPLRQLLCRFWPTRPTLQRRAFSVCHVQSLQRATHAKFYQMQQLYSTNS